MAEEDIQITLHGTVDTSVSTNLTLGGLTNAADEFIYLERYIIQVYL